MRKLMVMVILLAVALIAAPAIAQNDTTTPETPAGGPPGDDLGDSLPELPLPEAPTQEPPSQSNTTPEPPALELPAPEPPALEPPPMLEPTTPESPAQKDEGPVSDTGGGGTIPILEDLTSPGPDVADGPDGRTSDDNDDEIADGETDDDEVEAEARDDRIAARLLDQLKGDKKDNDDPDKDNDDPDKDNDDRDNDDTDKDDVKQNQDQDADSGDVDQDAGVINTGDNVNQCVGILQVANTGNAQNATGVTQYDAEADEIELENGSRISLTPQLVVDCRQIILQIVQGQRPNETEFSRERLREVIRPAARGAALANRTGAGVVVPSGRSGIMATPKVLSASSAGRPAGQQLRTSASRSLPRTGGSYATLVGLGTGVLLVGGGLLVRRLAR